MLNVYYINYYILFYIYNSSTSVILFLLLFLFFFFSLTFTSKKNYIENISVKFSFTFVTNSFFLFIFFLISLKFFILLFLKEKLLSILAIKTLDNFILLKFLYFISVGQYFTYLGWSLLFLCFLTSSLTLLYLGDRNLFLKGNSLFYFTFFLICTIIMISSSNLLIIFLSFELIFFPSLYFVYSLGYVKKVDKTIYFLLGWTLVGSFLVLCSFGYIYSHYKTLDFNLLIFKSFSYWENIFLFILIFIGFGIKLPIFPFHYWLTKVHVEAPAGFSMFLSGFLVKTALYCFYYISLLFIGTIIKKLCIIWICFCIGEASIKMWSQTDIKKLVAFATIQEMNMIMLCVLLLQFFNNNVILTFILMHGILSTFMFFLVDQLQKRTQTRNIPLLSGACSKFPYFKLYIWIMLIFYLGFPFTVKFILEWNIATLLLIDFGFVGFIIFFLALFFGGVGFTKCWLLILYGNPSKELCLLKNVDFFKKDKYFAILLCVLLFFFNFIFFFLIC